MNAMRRDSGVLLIEILMALAILSVGLLSFVGSFTTNLRAGRDLTERDEVRVALENVTEALRNAEFGEVYNDYNGASLEAPYLEGDPYGYPAAVQVTCYVNELAIPAEFGPVLDIDGTGGLSNPNASADYKLLPVQLTLTYGTSNGTQVRNLFLVIGEKDA
jgi:type II secretory pathway pseudopilin PulG